MTDQVVRLCYNTPTTVDGHHSFTFMGASGSLITFIIDGVEEEHSFDVWWTIDDHLQIHTPPSTVYATECQAYTAVDITARTPSPVVNDYAWGYPGSDGLCTDDPLITGCTMSVAGVKGKMICVLTNVTIYTTGNYKFLIDFKVNGAEKNIMPTITLDPGTNWYGHNIADMTYAAGTYEITSIAIEMA